MKKIRSSDANFSNNWLKVRITSLTWLSGKDPSSHRKRPLKIGSPSRRESRHSDSKPNTLSKNSIKRHCKEPSKIGGYSNYIKPLLQLPASKLFSFSKIGLSITEISDATLFFDY